MADENLTTAELAQRWKKSPKTLRNMRCAGKGPRYFKPDPNTVLYPLKEVLKYEKLAKRKKA